MIDRKEIVPGLQLRGCAHRATVSAAGVAYTERNLAYATLTGTGEPLVQSAGARLPRASAPMGHIRVLHLHLHPHRAARTEQNGHASTRRGPSPVTLRDPLNVSSHRPVRA